MIYLLLSILCAGSLVILFKIFEKFEIEILPAIVVNYFTCVICGLFFLPSWQSLINTENFSQPWFWVSLVLGFLYIQIFLLIAKTTLSHGISTSTIAMKLGLVFPVIMGFILYQETLTGFKILGVVCALGAVIFSSYKEKKSESSTAPLTFKLPLLVFLGSGFCDLLIQYSQKTFFTHGGFEVFSVGLFFAAFVTGLGRISYAYFNHEFQFKWNQVLGGIALGIPNYFSIYFFLQALNHLSSLGSSVVFPVNNIGIVLWATCVSWLVFKESLNKWNLVGIGLALFCIGLMTRG